MKMLPCPFCGTDEKRLVYENVPGLPDGEVRIQIYCDLCGATGPDGGQTEYEAVDAWNKRKMVKMLRGDPAMAEAVKAAYHAAVSLVRYTGLSDEIYPRQDTFSKPEGES